jgi:hypothetical protein
VGRLQEMEPPNDQMHCKRRPYTLKQRRQVRPEDTALQKKNNAMRESPAQARQQGDQPPSKGGVDHRPRHIFRFKSCPNAICCATS